jgi:integrase
MPRSKRKRLYGTGDVYQRGSTWAVRWREGGQRRYKGGFPSREQAERVRKQIVANVLSGKVGFAEDPKDAPTVAELAATWLEERRSTHPRNAKKDEGRWKLHLGPTFGRMLPQAIDHEAIRRFIVRKRDEGLSTTTVRHVVHLFSAFLTRLVEQRDLLANPVHTMPKSTRQLMRVAQDAKATPYLKKLADVRRVFLALPDPINVAYALGAFAGLRTGEILALDWARDVNLEAGRLHLQLQVKDGKAMSLKDHESREVPILAPLRPVLASWHLKTGGKGLVIAPVHPTRGRQGKGEHNFTKPHTLHKHLAAVLKASKLPGDLTWYRATRHTFASHFVLNGGSVALLSKILGHGSVQVTERYAHLAPSAFPPEQVEVFGAVGKLAGGKVTRLPRRTRPIGYTVGTQEGRRAASKRANARKH